MSRLAASHWASIGGGVYQHLNLRFNNCLLGTTFAMQKLYLLTWYAICYSKNYSCEFGTSFAYKRNPYVSIVSCGLASRFRWWFGRVHCRGPCQHQTLAFTGDIFSVAYRIHQSTLDLAWWSHDHVYTSLFCAHWRPEHVGIDVDFTCRGGGKEHRSKREPKK